MKRFILFFSCVFMCLLPLIGQEATQAEQQEQVLATEGDKDQEPESNPPIPKISGGTMYEAIRKGDQLMKVGLRLGVPLFNTHKWRATGWPKIWPGGNIFLAYNHYVTKRISIGASIDFGFYPTLGKNVYFQVPITFDTRYTFVVDRWRFLVGGDIGLIIQSYTDLKYFGLVIRPAFETYYQYSPEWSFGGDLAWNIIPEWYKESQFNRVGNILNISLGVRYHF